MNTRKTTDDYTGMERALVKTLYRGAVKKLVEAADDESREEYLSETLSYRRILGLHGWQIPYRGTIQPWEEFVDCIERRESENRKRNQGEMQLTHTMYCGGSPITFSTKIKYRLIETEGGRNVAVRYGPFYHKSSPGLGMEEATHMLYIFQKELRHALYRKAKAILLNQGTEVR